MNAEELRVLMHGNNYSKWEAQRVGMFYQWWWHEYLTDEQREAFYKARPDNDDISVDLLTLDDEQLMFAWAVFKM